MKANFNAYIWWYGKRFYGLIGQDGIFTKRGYILSHFSRLIRPGSVRIGATINSAANVFISAYKNGAKKIVVVVNTLTADVKQKISFQGSPAVSVIPYVTTSSKNVEQGSAITVSENNFVYTIPSKSIVTFVEQ